MMCNFIQKWLHSRLRKIDKEVMFHGMKSKEHIPSLRFFLVQDGMEHWNCSCGRIERAKILNGEFK